MYFGVPTVWSRVGDDPTSAEALRGARLLVSGSAPLPVPVFERLVELTGHAPVERYGMTETLITLSTRADGERRPGWVGLPIRGVRDAPRRRPRGDRCPTTGPRLATSRCAGRRCSTATSPAAGAADDDDGWFVTGDAAVVDGGGFHRIVGRTSIDIIKTGGYKVGAGEVEDRAARPPRRAGGSGRRSARRRPRSTRGGLRRRRGSDGRRDRRLRGRRAVATHKRPREIRLVGALPRNAMGKVQKSKLT